MIMNTSDVVHAHARTDVTMPEAVMLTWPRTTDLAGATTATAQRVYAQVAERYLSFRRTYYDETNPTLATMPPATNVIHQAGIARIAENTLRVVPEAIKAIPLIGGLLEHLQQVANIHSLSAHERLILHNTTMFFMHGVRDGLQPWYLDWLLATAENLSGTLAPEYFMIYPWDALLYLPPVELTVFQSVVRQGDIPGAEQVIERLAQRLCDALADPIGVQAKLAFTGPAGKEREAAFDLQTAAALALGGYLVVGGAANLLRHAPTTPPASVVAPLSPEMAALFEGRSA
jgi:hypothetical protein